MDRKLASLIAFLILFIITFIVDYFFVKKSRYTKRKKTKKKKIDDLTEIAYLVGKFNLDRNKLINNKILAIISCLNALIISLVTVVVLLININVILQLVIGFILLIALIYAVYEILGRGLLKRGYNKNDK